MEPTATEMTGELQALFSQALPGLMDGGLSLAQKIVPQQKTKIREMVLVSLGQTIFQLLEDIAYTFQQRMGSGYFSAATLTRGLIETSTILLLLKRDPTDKRLAAFVQKAEREAVKSRKGLQQIKNPDPHIARVVQAETQKLDELATELRKIISSTDLNVPAVKFPNMFERCRELGVSWEFMYYAAYRELSEAVHGSFSKLPYSASIAFRTENQGAALFYEHCRVMNHAVTFWGITILDLCDGHPDTRALEKFREELWSVMDKANDLLSKFESLPLRHHITL